MNLGHNNLSMTPKMANLFEQKYPNITQWVEEFGWIEIGEAEYSESLIRAFNEGGLVWENIDDYASLDEAFQALENSLKEWIKENE